MKQDKARLRCRGRQSLEDFETPAHPLLQLFKIVKVKATEVLTISFYFSISLNKQIILPKRFSKYFYYLFFQSEQNIKIIHWLTRTNTTRVQYIC